MTEESLPPETIMTSEEARDILHKVKVVELLEEAEKLLNASSDWEDNKASLSIKVVRLELMIKIVLAGTKDGIEGIEKLAAVRVRVRELGE